MMHRSAFLGIILLLAFCLNIQGKEVTDTLQSAAGDQIIVTYTLTQGDGKITVTFTRVQKKLSQANQHEYGNDLSKIAVVFFDRTGTYGDTKFEGMPVSSFMVPANVSYSTSDDGFFLLQDNPTLQFSVQDGQPQVSIPLFLAKYKRKGRYEVFAQCKPLAIELKASGGGGGSRAGRGSSGGSGGGGTEVVTSEELVDEGMDPTEEALIRIDKVKGMIERATKVTPDLSREIQGLSDIQYRVPDPAVRAQIDQVLLAWEQKQAEFEEQQAAAAAAEKAEQEQKAAEEQARQDSIQAAQEEKAAEDKKQMMWLIGGIAGLAMLFMGGKQVIQMIKNNKMQKQMMESVRKAQEAQQQMLGGSNSPLGQMAASGQRNARKLLTKEGEAAKQRLEALRRGNKQQPGAPAGNAEPQQPKKPSLNDAIPRKYKRWRKPGTESNDNNVTI